MHAKLHLPAPRCRPLIALVVLFAPLALAKLPPPSAQESLAATEAVARAAWSDKVSLFQLCNAIDRVAAGYRTRALASGKQPTPAIGTAACTDPGAYVSLPTPASSKPLEASGAHSPAGPAISPPGTRAAAAEIAKGTKQ